MAVEIYLNLDGIKGESLKSGAEDWIEISSFSNGAHNPSGVGRGSGHATGKVDISPITLEKFVDKSSPALFLHCCNGTTIPKGSIIVRGAVGDTTTKVYYQYDLVDVFVDSISWGGSTDEANKPKESISLSSKSIQITYTPQNPDGSQGSKIVTGWDISANKKL